MPQRLPSPSRIPLSLRLLLIVAFIHGTAWALATAPLQGPDEDAHAAYVQHLAETGHGPNRDAGSFLLSTELGTVSKVLQLRPTLQRPGVVPPWSLTDKALDEARSLPSDNGDGPNPAAHYPPLYYGLGAVAYHVSPGRSVLGRLTSVRMVGVLLLVGTVAAAWLLATELFTQRWQHALVAAVVALQPKLGFMAGVINPDILVTFLSALILWLSVRAVRRKLTPKLALALGGATAAALLTHPRCLPLVGLTVPVLLFGALRGRDLSRRALALSVTSAGALTAGAFLIATSWSRAHTAPGTSAIDAPGVNGAFQLRQFISYLWQFYFPKLGSMEPKVGPPVGYRQIFIETGWGSFASLEVNFSAGVYDLIWLAMAALTLATIVVAARRWESLRAAWPTIGVFVLYSGGLMLMLHYVSYRAITSDSGAGVVLTGRYLLGLAPLLGVMLAFVISALPPRSRSVVAGGLAAALAALALSGVALTAERFYG